MDKWREVAIKRILEAMEDIVGFGTSSTEDCPVCKYMKEHHNMYPYFSYNRPCTDNNDKPCPAWKSCAKFLTILTQSQSIDDKSSLMIEQLHDLINSIEE